MAEQAEGTPMIDGILIPNGYSQLTGMSTATSLVVPIYSREALIQAEAQDVRWTDDGQTPTASYGNIIKANTTLVYNGRLTAFKAIQVTTGAILNVTFYK